MADFFPNQLGQGASQPVLDWSGLLAAARAREHVEWTAPEAYFAVLLAAASCDGDVSAQEQDMLAALVHRSRALSALSEEELADLNTRVVARMRSDGPAFLSKACAAAPVDMRMPLLAQALDIVLCDGDVGTNESAFLNRLMTELHLPIEEVRAVASVMIVKNRY